MQALLDQASAYLIGGSIILLLTVTLTRSQKSMLENTALYFSKTQTVEFADFLEQELLLIGQDVPASDRITHISPPREITPGSGLYVTDSLSFSYMSQAGTLMAVDYVLTPNDTVQVDNSPVVLFELKRFENGTHLGSSSSRLRYFRIDLLNTQGLPISGSLDDTRLLRITAVNAIPFNENGVFDLQNTYWGKTIRPPNLEN